MHVSAFTHIRALGQNIWSFREHTGLVAGLALSAALPYCLPPNLRGISHLCLEKSQASNLWSKVNN